MSIFRKHDRFARETGGGQRIRYAVVGLGWISQAGMLPGFKNARENSELVALVSSDREKRERLGKLYGVERLCAYDDYDALLASGEVDAVYIALPNNMHREYAERAARQKIHVLCEKPMAPTEQDCQAMIRAADENGVKLMIAYRLHFEIANLECIEVVQSGKLGEPRLFDSVFTQRIGEGDIRLDPELGEDAAVLDAGIYCINAARYLFQDEPVEAFAQVATGAEPRYRGTGEMTTAILRFPEDRFATFTASYGAARVDEFEVVGTLGRLRLEPAYAFGVDLEQSVTVDGRTKRRVFARRDQFGPQLVYFSRCILEDESPEPSGWEGLADVRVIDAIHASTRSRAPVDIEPIPRKRRPSPEQKIERPPVSRPEMVRGQGR